MRPMWIYSAAIFAIAALISFGAGSNAGAQEKKSIRIGYAIAKTGPNSAGAGVTTIPNYKLWVEEVNKAGGIMVKSLGKKLPIEVIEYDDQSRNEEAVRAIERLATLDKVDFILSPWGTATNLAIGPTMHKYGYPHLVVTAVTEKAPFLAKRWPRSFWFLGMGSQGTDALSEVLGKFRENGKLNDKVAMVSVADGFGIDMARAARNSFKKSGFKLVYDKAYPVGTQDFAPIINEAKKSGADSFVAFSYPPGTFAMTETSKINGYNPKIFYLGVGTAFTIYGGKVGANAEGVMGTGGVDSGSPAFKDYAARHKKVTGQDPDRWASAVTYASLQMLQKAIERVGSLDKAAIAKDIANNTFDTVIGKVRMKDNIREDIWWVGQWQNGEFYGVSPTRLPGARALIFPKSAWK